MVRASRTLGGREMLMSPPYHVILYHAFTHLSLAYPGVPTLVGIDHTTQPLRPHLSPAGPRDTAEYRGVV